MEGLLIGILIVVFGIISLEIGMSAPILEIIAGVIGANVFQLIKVPWVDFIANFGILGLMFFAGLEVDKDELKEHFGASMAIASASYLAPFALILAIASLAFGFNLKSSSLIAISLSTTSLALVYPILKERRLLVEKTGHIILTSAMLIDVFSMISLVVIFGAFNDVTLIFLVITALFLYQAPRLGKWIFSRYRDNIVEFETKFVLLILLSLFFFSERIMVSEAVLAFIMGFLFSELLERHQMVAEKLRGIVFGFMSPIFFFKAGSYMMFNSFNLYTIILVSVFFPAAYLAKYFFSKILLPKLGLPDKQLGGFLGLVFNFRLTFGIVAALFGFEAGIITKNVYTAIVTIIIISSILSSTLMKVQAYTRGSPSSTP